MNRARQGAAGEGAREEGHRQAGWKAPWPVGRPPDGGKEMCRQGQQMLRDTGPGKRRSRRPSKWHRVL